MAAPAGVSSEPEPDPDVPETAATDPMALAPADPEPSGSVGAETAADPELSGPVGAEAAADPEPGTPADERARKGHGVSWLVTAGVVVVVLALAAAAGALAVTTHGFRPKTVVTYRPAAVFGLRAGDCLNSSQNGLSVTILSCATPHEAEVFATFGLTGSGWPGEATIQQQASNGCGERMAGYLNPELLDAGLTEQYVYPDQKAWQAGVRTVVCEVSSSTGPLTGSVRDGG
ncbi:MAG TPA: septum formation family protein [Streptosporangiaceae bacterium]|nr:septum formation family protein [Streptosporangiaceae bacterium]